MQTQDPLMRGNSWRVFIDAFTFVFVLRCAFFLQLHATSALILALRPESRRRRLGGALPN